MSDDYAFNVGDRVVFPGNDAVFQVTFINDSTVPTYDLRLLEDKLPGYPDIEYVPPFLLEPAPEPAPEVFSVWVPKDGGARVVVTRVGEFSVSFVHEGEHSGDDIDGASLGYFRDQYRPE